MSNDEAEQTLEEVGEATSSWRPVAEAQGLSRSEIEAMAIAFDHEESKAVQRLAST